jgi:hypothetical protein
MRCEVPVKPTKKGVTMSNRSFAVRANNRARHFVAKSERVNEPASDRQKYFIARLIKNGEKIGVASDIRAEYGRILRQPMTYGEADALIKEITEVNATQVKRNSHTKPATTARKAAQSAIKATAKPSKPSREQVIAAIETIEAAKLPSKVLRNNLAVYAA